MRHGISQSIKWDKKFNNLFVVSRLKRETLWDCKNVHFPLDFSEEFPKLGVNISWGYRAKRDSQSNEIVDQDKARCSSSMKPRALCSCFVWTNFAMTDQICCQARRYSYLKRSSACQLCLSLQSRISNVLLFSSVPLARISTNIIPMVSA